VLYCGVLTPIFVRAFGVVATFLMLLSSPAQSVPTVRLGESIAIILSEGFFSQKVRN
jgi:hypothetical protein